MAESEGQLALKRREKLAACGNRSIPLTSATDEDYAGGKSIGSDPTRAVCVFSTHRPRTRDRPLRVDEGLQHSLPSCRDRSAGIRTLFLLEGVEDGRWVLIGRGAVHHAENATE